MAASTTTLTKIMSDSLRGPMQLVIVLSHLSFAYAEPHSLFALANRFGTSVIALFFFISGYGLVSSLRRKGEAYWSGFWSGRVWRVAEPMLWITLLYMLVNRFILGICSGGMLERLALHGETPLPNAWFVFALVVLYTLFYLCFRFIRSPQLAIIGLFVGSLLFMGLCIGLGYGREWWMTTLAFASGSLYAQREQQIYSWVSHWWGLIFMVVLVAGILVYNQPYLLALSYILIPIVFIRLAHLSGYARWIESSATTHLGQGVRLVLNFLGSISYELYLLHGVMIVWLRSSLFFITNSYLYSLAVIISSIILAFVAHRLLALINKK